MISGTIDYPWDGLDLLSISKQELHGFINHAMSAQSGVEMKQALMLRLIPWFPFDVAANGRNLTGWRNFLPPEQGIQSGF